MTTTSSYGALCALFAASALSAQQTPDYTDFIPKYKTADKSYGIEKISYYPHKTVIWGYYICPADQRDSDMGGGMSLLFYPPASPNAWALTATVSDSLLAWDLEKIQQIRRNGRVECANLCKESPICTLEADLEENTLFQFELHFPALPAHIRQVDLLEGKTFGAYPNRLHFNQIKLKTAQSRRLGSSLHSRRKLRKLRQRYPRIPNQ